MLTEIFSSNIVAKLQIAVHGAAWFRVKAYMTDQLSAKIYLST